MSKDNSLNEAVALVMIAAREAEKMTLRAFADYLGVSPATLSRIENGKGCGIDTVIALSVGLGVEPGEFMSRCFELAGWTQK